jgi:regulator of nonsense transcripts 2
VLRRCVTSNDTAILPRPDPHIRTPQVISALHRRFPTEFTPALVTALGSALAPPNKAALATLAPEQREKEDSVRLTRQRPILRVCAELALVGVIRDSPTRSGGEWILKALRDLVCFFRDGIAPELV